MKIGEFPRSMPDYRAKKFGSRYGYCAACGVNPVKTKAPECSGFYVERVETRGAVFKLSRRNLRASDRHPNKILQGGKIKWQ